MDEFLISHKYKNGGPFFIFIESLNFIKNTLLTKLPLSFYYEDLRK